MKLTINRGRAIIAFYGLLFLAIVFGATYLSHKQSATATGNQDCSTAGKHRTLTIAEAGFTPAQITAQRCDILTLTNKGRKSHWVAFGPHEKHIHFPGYTERPISSGERVTFTLQKTGTYEYHDHFNEELEGQITIE